MQFSASFIAAVVAIASTASANSCVKQYNGLNRYIVETSGSPSGISGWCGGLWDNLKRFPICNPSQTFCGAVGNSNNLRWEFTASSSCNGGHVESTWWEATKNELGSIDCP
ncbi:hypothetical protein VTL71DRAFT_6942 [Oculimacula yallundae]|uniref:Uncharacterized protein n=1 Tax=Oculimacula yallundae TaxID=86028 RepID=A0ABR4BVA2_9HELO